MRPAWNCIGKWNVCGTVVYHIRGKEKHGRMR
jgi:hypothetical protein